MLCPAYVQTKALSTMLADTEANNAYTMLWCLHLTRMQKTQTALLAESIRSMLCLLPILISSRAGDAKL